jgi:CO/xanthine dehydrogenase Mo-binding subunit
MHGVHGGERRGEPLLDGGAKVTGKAVYTWDMALPHMLHGKLLRSPLPHARIRHIDTAPAMEIPGVICIVTGEDVASLSDRFYGVGLRDQPVIALDRVRYVGDPVAAIVAVDEATAFRAAQAVRVEYEPLPPLMTVDDALADDAPALFEGPTSGIPIPVGMGCSSVADPARNVLCEYKFAYGDLESSFGMSDKIFTDTFAVTRINHFHLEPHVNIAHWSDGRLEMWSCNQDPFVIRVDLARIFGLPLHRVRIHTPLVGGGFGGKSYCKMEPLVALMARRAGAPVRLALSMDESILTLVKHPARLTLTTGVDRDGHLTARRADVVLDGGAYSDASALVAVKTGFRVGGGYRWQAIASRARVVRTTTVPSGSFRGFGGTQASFASERQIDLIARRLGEDPFAFRMRNLLDVNQPFAPGDRGMDSDLCAGLQDVADRIDYFAERRQGRGIGFAVGLKDAGGTGNHAQALVRVTQDGEVMVSAAVVDVGQGASSALCRIATDILGLPLANATYASIDTDHSPPDNGTHVSCGTLVTGRAIEQAAADVRRQIEAFAAERLDCDVSEIVLDGWTVRRGNVVHPLAPMIRKYYGGIGWEFIGRGAFKEPYNTDTPMGARNISWMPCWSAAEVGVDAETGRVTLHRLVVSADPGRALSQQACRGQIEGAAIQALGQALFEELRYRGDEPENATPLTYRVPKVTDLPERFESVVAEHGMGFGPGGVKGIGEAGMLGVAAAIANAIQDATGASLTAMPFTPQNVLDALDREAAGAPSDRSDETRP